MTMDADNEKLQPQAKVCQQTLEAGGGKEWIFFLGLQRESALLTP